MINYQKNLKYDIKSHDIYSDNSFFDYVNTGYSPEKNRYRRGDIYYADLSPAVGSEQNGMRPVVIIQNNIGNTNGPTLIVAPVSSTIKPYMPTHVYVPELRKKTSYCLLEQIRTIDKSRIRSKLVCRLSRETIDKIDKAIAISVGVSSN